MDCIHSKQNRYIHCTVWWWNVHRTLSSWSRYYRFNSQQDSCYTSSKVWHWSSNSDLLVLENSGLLQVDKGSALESFAAIDYGTICLYLYFGH